MAITNYLEELRKEYPFMSNDDLNRIISRAKFYYFSLYTSIIILLVSPISALIGYFCGAIKGYITLEADVFFVALLIYAVTRLMDAQNSKIVIEENKEKAEIELPSEAQENISDDSE